jgi:hypothetical protein
MHVAAIDFHAMVAEAELWGLARRDAFLAAVQIRGSGITAAGARKLFAGTGRRVQ